MIVASAPEPVDGVAHVSLENGSEALAELLPSEARDLAADLLAAALFAENGWGCLSELVVPKGLRPHRQERTSAAARGKFHLQVAKKRSEMRELIAKERSQARRNRSPT